MQLRRNAFTLIELLVVIVIIGILATVSTATFGGAMEKARFAKVQAFAKQIEEGSGIPLGVYSFSEGSGTTLSGKDPDMAVGTISGATWTTESPSGDGSALFFDGNDRIMFPGSGDLNEYPVKTISFWVDLPNDINASTATSQPVIQFYRDLVLGTYSQPFLGFGPSSTVCTGETFIIMSQGSDGGRRTCVTATIEAGIHHFAIMWNGISYDIYIDGEKQSTIAGGWGHSQILNADIFSVGWNQYGSYFTGTIDNIRIYSDAIDIN